jgi:hypothetical protein
MKGIIAILPYMRGEEIPFAFATSKLLPTSETTKDWQLNQS